MPSPAPTRKDGPSAGAKIYGEPQHYTPSYRRAAELGHNRETMAHPAPSSHALHGPIELRTTWATVWQRKTSVLAIIFTLAMLALAVLFVSSALQATGTFATLYGIASLLPLLGVVVAWWAWWQWASRVREPAVLIDALVRIPRTGVRFALPELGCVQLFNRSGTSYAALLPRHEKGRVPADIHSVDPYIVRFPAGARPQPFELGQELARRVPGLNVDKLGNI